MDSPRVYFQTKLGFLLAVKREAYQSDNTFPEFAHRLGRPLETPPAGYSKIPKNVENRQVTDQYHLFRAQWAIEQLEIEIQKKKLRSWTVEFDPLVQEHQSNHYEWVGLKLTSPEYLASTHTLETDLFNVLGILNKNFLTVANSATRLELAVRLAGLYVNVDQLKAIASMIWMADPLLSEIHPSHCGPGALSSLGLQYTNLVRDYPIHLKTELASSIQIEDPWNNRLSLNRRPLETLPHPGELKQAKYRHGADKILNADTIEGLVHLLNVEVQDIRDYPQARPAYGFRVERATKHFILDFNQHCGSLDFDEIINWTALCVKIFLLCLGRSHISLFEAYPGLRYTSDIYDFLAEHNLNLVSDYYKKKPIYLKVTDLKDWPLVKSTLAHDESKPIVSPHWPSTRSLPSPLAEFALRALNWESSRKNTGRSTYSFGIELEMYMPAVPQGITTLQTSPVSGSPIDSNNMSAPLIDFSDSFEWSDPNPEDDRKIGSGSFHQMAANVADFISSKGLLTLLHDRYVECGTHVWRNKLSKHGVVPISGVRPPHQTWTILDDASLKAWEDWAGYWKLAGLEVISPILRDTPKGWEEALDMVGILRNNYRLAVTRSCGFHIHVAKGTEPLSLHLLRKVSVLVYCAENMIYRLCHPERRNNRWTKQLMGGSTLFYAFMDSWTKIDVSSDFEQYIPVDKIVDSHVLGCLKKLWATTTVGELQRWLKPDYFEGRSCIRISELEDSPNFSNEVRGGTVEFRYLEGTLDPELILRWGQLMVSLFQFADLATPEAWRVFIPTVLQCQESGHCDLNMLRMFLMLLGLGSDYDFWTTRIGKFSQSPVEGREREPGKRPSEGHEIQPCVDESQMDSLRKNVCQRQRTLPCLIQRERPTDEPKSPTDPESRAKILLEKAGFTSKQVEKVSKNANEKGLGRSKAKARPSTQSREGGSQRAGAQLLKVLQASRDQAEKDVQLYYGK
ncbi:hypothetical protein KAF25_007471 [Fusarium avenaceum]|uniref:Uncharacterized protein n=1 Tax=Fusarium avenaceum TaxID=40199 RepID=A0A9P7KQK5_9HYPO|nr:hypothetical protein KAF25_007471 [Fusarium avenaceum]